MFSFGGGRGFRKDGSTGLTGLLAVALPGDIVVGSVEDLEGPSDTDTGSVELLVTLPSDIDMFCIP